MLEILEILEGIKFIIVCVTVGLVIGYMVARLTE